MIARREGHLHAVRRIVARQILRVDLSVQQHRRHDAARIEERQHTAVDIVRALLHRRADAVVAAHHGLTLRDGERHALVIDHAVVFLVAVPERFHIFCRVIEIVRLAAHLAGLAAVLIAVAVEHRLVRERHGQAALVEHGAAVPLSLAVRLQSARDGVRREGQRRVGIEIVLLAQAVCAQEPAERRVVDIQHIRRERYLPRRELLIGRERLLYHAAVVRRDIGGGGGRAHPALAVIDAPVHTLHRAQQVIQALHLCRVPALQLVIDIRLRAAAVGDIADSILQIRAEGRCGDEERHAQKQAHDRRAVALAAAAEVLHREHSLEAEELLTKARGAHIAPADGDVLRLADGADGVDAHGATRGQPIARSPP